MVKSLVTGASGFIGSHLVEFLSDNGHKVRALVRNPKKYSFPKGVEVKVGNLGDLNSLMEACKDIDVVIHAAAVVNSSKRKDYEEVNVLGTRNIVEASVKNKVKKFVYISTCDVIFDPKGLYGGTKLKGEKIVEKSGLTYVMLRPNTVYGSGGDRGIGKLIRLIKKSFIVPVIGSGNSLLQPIFVDDLCECVLRVSGSKFNNDVFEIGGPDLISYNQLVDLISKELNVKRIKFPIPTPISKVGADVYNKFFDTAWSSEKIVKLVRDKKVDISRMVNELGVGPRSVQDGLKALLK